MRITNVLILVFLWSVYFAVHSVLASLVVKRWLKHNFPGWIPYYRLAYNLIATLLLIVPVGFMYAHRGVLLWHWSGYTQWLADALMLAAILGFVWTLRYYDMGIFTGIKQTRERSTTTEDTEGFKISPMHRYVRHPWYFLGLIIIWSREMDYLYLTTAVAVTLYLWLGAKLEERKLAEYYGDNYRRYCQQVPGIIPRPWRVLSRSQAAQLEAGSRSPDTAPE